jgi:hypothetical protein
MGLYETRGKMKNKFNFRMKPTLNMFFLKNNTSSDSFPKFEEQNGTKWQFLPILNMQPL